MALPKEAPLYRALGLVLTGGNGLEECGLKAPEAFDANKEQDPSNMHSRNLQEKKIGYICLFWKKAFGCIDYTHQKLSPSLRCAESCPARQN